METVARIWRQVGPRIYGLALILKVGIPLVFVLSLAIGGYAAYSAISTQVTQFEKDVQHQVDRIKQNAAAIQKPVADFNRQFEKVMGTFRPVVNAINKVGKIWPISKLSLDFLRLPTFPKLSPVIDRTRALARSALELQTPLLRMAAQVRETYEKLERVATIVSTLFLLWVMAMVVVFGARWSLELVEGWKLLIHGSLPVQDKAPGDFQTQIDALRAEIGRAKPSDFAESRRQPWLVLLALLLLCVYLWNSQDRLLALFNDPPDRSPAPVVEVEPSPPAPEEQEPMLVLDGELLFASGSAAISAEGRQVMRSLVLELLAALEQTPDLILVVNGHTDDTPIKVSGFSSNQELSLARANAVAGLLVREGLPEGRVAAIGHGASQPRIPNDDAISRLLNRRVELWLAPREALFNRSHAARTSAN